MAFRRYSWRALPVLVVLLLQSARCFADDPTPADPAEPRKHLYEEAVPREHSTRETMFYLGALYAVSLVVYVPSNTNEIFNNATFTNYTKNLFNISIFDQDLPGANWGIHLITGALAYEFFRARSYSKEDSFLLTLAQECLFQFTIETLIVPTGMENVVNTAVIGTVIGRGFEEASIPMMNSDFVPVKALGYLLNLPTLLGLNENRGAFVPVIAPGVVGAQLRVGF